MDTPAASESSPAPLPPRDWGLILIPALILLLALGLRLSDMKFPENIANITFDIYQQRKPRPNQVSPVGIVVIDDESISRLGQWPWPRTLHAKLISKLSQQGASAIALNILFTEPDRTSPEFALQLLPRTPDLIALRAKLKALPSNDRLLAMAMAKAKVVTSFARVFTANQDLPAAKARFKFSGDNPLISLLNFPGSIKSLPEIEAAAAGNGCSALNDGSPNSYIRQVPLLCRQGKTLYPTVSLEALRVAQGGDHITVESTSPGWAKHFGDQTHISRIAIGTTSVPTDSEGRLWVYYSTGGIASISAWRILEPDFSLPALKGAIIFVGVDATGLGTRFRTPFGDMSGVYVQAEILDQILLQKFLLRPAWASGVEITSLVLLGMGLIFLMPRLGGIWSGVLSLFAILVMFNLSWLAFIHKKWLIDPLFATLTTMAVYLSYFLINYVRSEKERRRLLELDKVKDELISMVSHDLRGPVSTMIMAVDIISRGNYGPLSEKQNHYLQMIKNSGLKLNAFISNILDAAKIKAGKMEFHKREIRVQEMLPALVDFFTLSASAKGLSLDQKYPQDLPSILGDQEKLEQVINNLVGNAMKFTPSGGRITLEAEPDGDFVRFSVTDTGYGISAEDLPKLFAQFQQVNLAQSKQIHAGGTGLGLSICKTIAESHGGKIWVESKKEKGSSFRFTIPKYTAGT